MAGLSAARARGRVGGRKPKLSEKQIREIKALLSDPAARVKDIAERYGVSRATLYKRVGVVQPMKSGLVSMDTVGGNAAREAR